MNRAFWKNKRIFVTGHTGFKGSWLCLWLKSMESIVTGYSLPPSTSPKLFELAEVAEGMQSILADIRDERLLRTTLIKAQPEIVIHLAAQPLVRYSYTHPVDTYSTNIMGTINLLEAIRQCNTVKSTLVVTSDKCYENREFNRGYNENDAMGGYDPYSSSKGCTELVAAAYRRSFFADGANVALATARAGNVIAGGDWSEDRLIPDMVRAFTDGKEMIVRNPDAVRPWQHVFDALHGYLLLLENMNHSPEQFSGAWNFGPKDEDAKNVEWIVKQFIETWGQADWRIEVNHQAPHEANLLKLDCRKAMDKLSWKPILNVKRAIDLTASWYRAHSNGQKMNTYSIQQLADYQLRLQ